MNKQIKLYSVRLGVAKTKEEKRLTGIKNLYNTKMFNIKSGLAKRTKIELKAEEWNEECRELFSKKLKKHKRFQLCEKIYKLAKEKLHNELLQNKTKGARKVDSSKFTKKNEICVFDNSLTRTLLLDGKEITKEFITIEANNEDNVLLEQVIIDELIIDDIKYMFFTAGAGQSRKQKFLMIKKETWEKYETTLMCGLTIDKINKLGGMNINKFLAYLALNCSASNVIEGFDINRCIVVEDFETIVNDEVDYLTRDDKAPNGTTTYITKKGKEVTRKNTKVDWNIKRTTMDVPVPHMDGCGICLPSFSKKNQQIRLPWMKGLISPTPFNKYAKEVAKKTKVKDIYGREYDIIEDNIQVIFTKSQFKMHKYYKSWDEYKTFFKEFNCTANLCKEDEDEYKDMNINYQMLQTLTKMKDEEIEIFTGDLKVLLNKVHSDRKEQLEFLGAVKTNKKRDYFQEILRLYPEMLTSAYVKGQISDTITAKKKDAKSGRIKLNAKRPFLIPDVVAFMDWLFTGNKKPVGMLKKNEVSFKLYEDKLELAVLRSPHLSREWAIRENICNEDTKKWFLTSAIYTSSHDLISKILAFDNDGDEALVVAGNEKQQWLIDLAKRQMENIRPLYYEMGKADAEEINMNNIYKSLKFVYEKSNIGKVSNTLTDIWNRDDSEDHMDSIKKICAYNNFIIDSAKTLEVPKIPSEIKELIKDRKYPYFFQFAKNKKAIECKSISNSVMDRICKSIDNIKYKEFNYSKGFGKFKVAKLMNNSKISIPEDVEKNIIKMYLELEAKTRKDIQDKKIMTDNDNKISYRNEFYAEARLKVNSYAMLKNINYKDIVDIIIKYSFKSDDNKMKFIFEVFGATIINNINRNIKESVDKGYILCECCGKRTKKKSNAIKRCTKCSKEENIKKTIANKKSA